MDVDSMERRYHAWRVLYDSGEISREEFQRHVDSLAGQDEDGRNWRVDIESGHWLRKEGDRWIAADPRQPVARPAAPVIEPPGAQSSGTSPAPQLSFAAWLKQNWGWAAVFGAGIVLLVAAAFFLATVFLVPDAPPEEVEVLPTPASGSTPAPVDIQVLPTDTLAPPPTGSASLVDRGHEMVLVPEGQFRMGTTDEELRQLYALCDPVLGNEACRRQGFEAEQPAHDVSLRGYYIDVHEVTNEQFAAFLTEGGNQTGSGQLWYEASDEAARIQFLGDRWQALPGYETHPATEMTWFGAQAYCEWRGGRLPTEAEWEKGARWNPASGEVTVYPWGNWQPDTTLANFGITNTGTRPVGSLESGKSPLGLYDMAGNVFEWVSDWFVRDYTSAGANNPQGPESGEAKVIRGGSWGDNAYLIRAANRGFLAPTVALNFVGFRCVKDPAAVTPGS